MPADPEDVDDDAGMIPAADDGDRIRTAHPIMLGGGPEGPTLPTACEALQAADALPST